MMVLSRLFFSGLLVFSIIYMAGCSYITIENPSQEEALVTRPYDLNVEHTGCGSVQPGTFQALLDKGMASEQDITNAFSYSNELWSAPNQNLPIGSHTFTASASVTTGGWCYVGRAMDTREFEVHCTVGAFDITTSTPAYPPRDLTISGNLAYVTDSGHGMHIFDVSDPANPVGLGFKSMDAPGEIEVAGNFAYIEDQGVLRIIDVSNPANPSEVGHTAPGFADDMEYKDGILYVATATAMRTIDVVPPQAPQLLGLFNPASRDARSVAIVGNYAYFANVDSLFILDVSDPTNPVEVGRIDPGRPIDVEVADGVAYVTDESGDSSLHIIDVSNPSSPVEISHISTPELRYGDVEIVGGMAYIATNTDAVRVIDVSNPSAPIDRGSIKHFSADPLDAGIGSYDIEVVDNRIYVRTSRSVRIVQLPCL